MQINVKTDSGEIDHIGVVETSLQNSKFTIKSYLFDKIYDCSGWNVVEQIGGVCIYIVFDLYQLKFYAV
jgi:hypothetical protein